MRAGEKEREQAERGMMATDPGTITPHMIVPANHNTGLSHCLQQPFTLISLAT